MTDYWDPLMSLQAEDDVLVACALSEEGEVYVCDSDSAKNWGLVSADEKANNQRLLKDVEVWIKYNIIFSV